MGLEESTAKDLLQLSQRLLDSIASADWETRVWQRIKGQWRHVHFHRSAAR